MQLPEPPRYFSKAAASPRQEMSQTGAAAPPRRPSSSSVATSAGKGFRGYHNQITASMRPATARVGGASAAATARQQQGSGLGAFSAVPTDDPIDVDELIDRENAIASGRGYSTLTRPGAASSDSAAGAVDSRRKVLCSSPRPQIGAANIELARTMEHKLQDFQNTIFGRRGERAQKFNDLQNQAKDQSPKEAERAVQQEAARRLRVQQEREREERERHAEAEAVVAAERVVEEEKHTKLVANQRSSAFKDTSNRFGDSRVAGPSVGQYHTKFSVVDPEDKFVKFRSNVAREVPRGPTKQQKEQQQKESEEEEEEAEKKKKQQEQEAAQLLQQQQAQATDHSPAKVKNTWAFASKVPRDRNRPHGGFAGSNIVSKDSNSASGSSRRASSARSSASFSARQQHLPTTYHLYNDLIVSHGVGKGSSYTKGFVDLRKATPRSAFRHGQTGSDSARDTCYDFQRGEPLISSSRHRSAAFDFDKQVNRQQHHCLGAPPHIVGEKITSVAHSAADDGASSKTRKAKKNTQPISNNDYARDGTSIDFATFDGAYDHVSSHRRLNKGAVEFGKQPPRRAFYASGSGGSAGFGGSSMLMETEMDYTTQDRHVPHLDLAKISARPSQAHKFNCKAETYDPEYDAVSPHQYNIAFEAMTSRDAPVITTIATPRTMGTDDAEAEILDVSPTRPRTVRDVSMSKYSPRKPLSSGVTMVDMKAMDYDAAVNSPQTAKRVSGDPLMGKLMSRNKRERVLKAGSTAAGSNDLFYDVHEQRKLRGQVEVAKHVSRAKKKGGRMGMEYMKHDGPGPGAYNIK